MLQGKEKEKSDFYTLNTSEQVGKIGAKITGRYTDDLDIPKIHLYIRDIFIHNIREKSSLVKRLVTLNSCIEKFNGSSLRKRELIKEKIDLESTLHKFSEEGWDKYVEEVKPILEKYKQITSIQKSKKFFIGGKSPDLNKNEDPQKIDERLKIIRNFLRIANNYIEIDIICYPPYQEGCPECGLSIDKMNIDEDQGVYVCDCDIIFGRVYTMDTPHIDPDKVDSGAKNSYDDKTNFVRRLKSYQGIQSRKLLPELLETIDTHVQKKYSLPPADVIKTMPLDEYGRRGTPQVSVKLLIEALKETDNSQHFQDINPICYELWGWKCPSIDSLVPRILDDYTKTQEVYKKDNPNFSSINVELRLYWHLCIAGHKCLIEDFKIPQSKESRKRNSCIFKKMCEEVGLKFHAII